MTLEQQPVEYQLAGVRARKGSGITAVFDNPIQRSKRAKNSLALSKLPVGHLAVVSPKRASAEADEGGWPKDSKLKHESLILAQNQRWRHA